MKNIVFIYCGFNLTHAFDRLFSNTSAFEKVLLWTKEIPDCENIVVLTNPETTAHVKEDSEKQNIKISIIEKNDWNTAVLLETMSAECDRKKCQYGVFTTGDKPFLDRDLTWQVLEDHKKYLAEYTFADGYAEGFAPQVISCGTLNIISSIAKEKTECGNAEISNQCIFDVLKTDINSFEIESVIAPEDFRMWRFDFSCSSKLLTVACKRLYDLALTSRTPFNAVDLTHLAQSSNVIQQTVPAFYNVQISSKSTSNATYNPKFPFCDDENPFMNLEHFKALVSQIHELSEEAVISLSAFGDPFTNPDLLKYIETVLEKSELNLLIETEAHCITLDFVNQLKVLLAKYNRLKKSSSAISQLKNRINFIVSVDAVTAEKYFMLHKSCISGPESFNVVISNLAVLEEAFPGCVYPQFLRTQENEDELEKFYRMYHDKNSITKGRLIIQKYDNYCKTLPEKKCADLSPLERNVCWHLKRDVTILKNGDVPVCKELYMLPALGNVFTEGLDVVWNKTAELVKNQIENKYTEKCEACDEYYTFNF